jgi:hypothetical protein
MKLEDATKLLIELLRNPDQGSFGKYGYEIYLPALLKTYFVKQQEIQLQDTDQKLYELSPVFYEAGWELCRRGILRPGIKCYGEQATADGGAGNGYSITQFGRTWLQESHLDNFVPTEPERFGEILAKYKSKFGASFHERAQQAIRCYGAHAYLACCVMCGASSESIILSAAIAKEQNETEVLNKYRSANGRYTIENILIGKARKQLQEDYRDNSKLLKYWRNEAAHGMSSNIEDNEAYISLALLLRLSMFINDNWDELVNTTLG